MIVAIAWLLLGAVAVSLEVAARRGAHVSQLSEIAARLAGTALGRLVLVACWAFVGWHLFARYTIPAL